MKSVEILKQTTLRSFKYTSRSWKFYQEWNKTVFLHWEVSPELIKPYPQKGVKLDKIHGKTWVSLVAFDMNNIGVRELPKPPYISDFQEINIRVYVVSNGKPSVYFLSMQGSKQTSCKVLKALSKFPYRYSKIHRNEFAYTSKNDEFNDAFNIEYEIKNESIKKDETDLWLTERYAVFQDYKTYLIEYDMHHVEWPMQTINVEKLELNYPRFSHLLHNQPDRVHDSSGVKVLTWDKITHKKI